MVIIWVDKTRKSESYPNDEYMLEFVNNSDVIKIKNRKTLQDVFISSMKHIWKIEY